MAETLLSILGISALIAIPTQSLLLSLNAGSFQLSEILKHKKVLFKYILTMFIIIPLLAVVFYNIFGGYTLLWVALLIISLTPASPAVIKKMNKLQGDKNISLEWMILTVFLSLIFIPLFLKILENVFNIDLDLGISEVTMKIFTMFILPMVIGFAISKFLGKHVEKIRKLLDPINKIAMLVLVICLLILAVPIIISKGIVPFALIFLFIVVALIISHIMSSPEKVYGPILPHSVVSRLPAPAIVLMQVNNSVQEHMATVLTYTILGALVMAVYYKVLFKKPVE